MAIGNWPTIGLICSALLTGQGAGAAESTDTDNTQTTSSIKTLVDWEMAGYLEANQIVLADLDPSLAGSGAVDVSVISGPKIQMKVGEDGILRYLSPPEQYDETTTSLLIKSPSGDHQFKLNLPWFSRIGAPISQILEGPEDESAIAQLTVSGIDDLGTVNSSMSALVYTLTSPQAISAEECMISLNSPSINMNLRPMFDIDEAAGTIALKPGSLREFLSAVKLASHATLTFSLSTAGAQNGYGFEQAIFFGDGTVTVAIVDPSLQPDSDFAGTQFVISGMNTGIKTLGTLNTDGELSVGNLPADTFLVQQVMLDPGSPLIGVVTLPTADASANLQMIVGNGSEVNLKHQVGARSKVTEPGSIGTIPHASRK